MAEKLFITNQKKQKIAVLLEKRTPQKGLVFIMPGLGGFKEQLHIQAFAAPFLEEKCTVVRFDPTNSNGESGGKYEDATTTSYLADLEDVILWAKTQEWYQEPFWLCGHSLGSMVQLLYAEKHPQEVKALAPLATVISGKLSCKTPSYKEMLDGWKSSGWIERKSVSKPGVLLRLPYSHMQERLKYDVLPKIKKVTMPVLLVVGELDDSTPVEHQQILFEKLPGQKELHIIKGAPHTFREEKHLKEIQEILKKWIQKTNT